jgi:malate dehydrogenase (quinone)
LSTETQQLDVLLVGGGIMSATLAILLNTLDENLNIQLVERLPNIAQESSDAWNNAGTGHAGFCELNYTPQKPSGTVETKRALGINAAFETSLQFWSHLVDSGVIPNPSTFISPTPHISFVEGRDNVAFLRERFLNLKTHHLFSDMQYAEDAETLREWMPLVMQGRESNAQVAATRVSYGTDVNFGTLTRSLVDALKPKATFDATLNTEVTALKKLSNGRWQISLTNRETNKTTLVESQFVFLGAGGGALKLLQKSGIPESIGYGGFPVSGQWLVCHNPAVIAQHQAKVYGKAAIGAPPMSVPHLDTRIINGKKALLFGPYAGFTTKFLKTGSFLDLVKSIKPNNLTAMLSVGRDNMDLTKYLVNESLQTHKARMATLRQLMPEARDEDWTLENAGKRVQVIKGCSEKGGKLEFGTEIVSAQDGSIAGLLGASPGASVATKAMVDVIELCFKDQVTTPEWQAKLKTMIPSYGESLIDDADLLKSVRAHNLKTLKLV